MKRYLIVLFVVYVVTILAKPEPNKFALFEEWYKDVNPSYANSKLKVQIDASDYREQRPGMIAKEVIQADEVLFKIPKDLIISGEFVEFQSEIAETLKRYFIRYADEDDHYDPTRYDALGMWLLHEKYCNYENSKWKFWLDVLPSEEDMNNILFWRNSEIKELEGSPLHVRAVDRRTRNTEKFQWARDEIFRTFPRVWTYEPTENDWKWAISIARSMNFHLFGTEKGQPCFVPMLDMFQHEIIPITEPLANKEAWVFNENSEQETIIVSAIRKFEAESQVYLPWVEKCNSELLDFWGFVDVNNPNDCVHIDRYLEISKNDPLFNIKNVLYRLMGPENSRMKMTRIGITEHLLQAARVLTISEDELTNDMMINGVPNEDLGLPSNLVISAFLVDISRTAYKAYPTTPEQDAELLKNPDLTPRQRMAIEMRKGEKEIIKIIGSFYYQNANYLQKELQLVTETMKDEL